MKHEKAHKYYSSPFAHNLYFSVFRINIRVSQKLHQPNMSFNPLINEVFEDYDGMNIVDITSRCNEFNLSSSIITEDNNTFYGICLNGNDRVTFMSYSQPSSPKESLIQEVLNVVSAYFRPSLDITYFFLRIFIIPSLF